MNPQFDTKNPACRNGPVSHSVPATPPAAILYSLRRHGAAASCDWLLESATANGALISMRVIAGKYRSRTLRSLPGLDLRPTADRLRETLFNVLTAGNPDALAGAAWIDVYAGTGAVGIEALSRGAGMAYFIERAAERCGLIRKNLSSLGIESGFQILKQDSIAALRALESDGVAADFVFLDPPYKMKEAYADTLAHLAQSRLLKSETVVITEHEKKFDLAESFHPLQRYRKLVQGDAALSFYQVEAV